MTVSDRSKTVTVGVSFTGSLLSDNKSYVVFKTLVFLYTSLYQVVSSCAYTYSTCTPICRTMMLVLGTLTPYATGLKSLMWSNLHG